MVLLWALSAMAFPPSCRLMASSSNGSDGAAAKSAPATLKTASTSSPDIPFGSSDPEAERILLTLANRSRAQAGLPPLALDSGLCAAAGAHARAMVAAHALSHQFAGEPSLTQRIVAATQIQLDQDGENVAVDFNAQDGHQHLMESPPHRANLLNGTYNVVGLAAVRSGDSLYIVQDFGHALPSYSPAEFKDRIAAAMTQARRQARQPVLAHRDLATADSAACSMALVDQLRTSAVQQLEKHYSVLAYTVLSPETLPEEASQLLSARNLHSYSLGACYARTPTYPTGVYWVVLAMQ